MLATPPAGRGDLHKGFTGNYRLKKLQPNEHGPPERAGHARCGVLGRPGSGHYRVSLRPCIARTHRAPAARGIQLELLGTLLASRACAGGHPSGYWPRSGSPSRLPPTPTRARACRACRPSRDAGATAVSRATPPVSTRRRASSWRPWLAAAALCAFGLVVAVDVHWMEPSGAAVFGWPLAWALPLLAYRALGLGLSKHVAWDFGVALSLLFVALTVVAVAYLGRNATGRRRLGLLAAAFWAVWPLLVGLIAGHHAWTNGQWEVDAGLHNYSEPLSTLLVTAGAALILAPGLTDVRLALAGCALSYATLSCLRRQDCPTIFRRDRSNQRRVPQSRACRIEAPSLFDRARLKVFRLFARARSKMMQPVSRGDPSVPRRRVRPFLREIGGDARAP